MHFFQKVAFVVGLIPVLASASAMANEVSSTLAPISATVVSNQGVVLKTTNLHPFTTFVIGIPAQVLSPSACTAFVGQQNTVLPNSNVLRITVMGASDPVNDMCIAVMPTPVDTQLTFTMKVTTGGFAPANQFQTAFVQVGNAVYQVTLNLATQQVSILPR